MNLPTPKQLLRQSAAFGALIAVGPGAVLLVGTAINVVALVIGIVAGPHVPRHRRTLRRPQSHNVPM